MTGSEQAVAFPLSFSDKPITVVRAMPHRDLPCLSASWLRSHFPSHVAPALCQPLQLLLEAGADPEQCPDAEHIARQRGHMGECVIATACIGLCSWK